jgi:hypothetical protein
MISEKQLEANHQNALRSTGPKTMEGVETVKFNALRHSLRSVQTVVPGEDPAAWEAHQAAVIEDLKPAGALEYALVEQIAAKLWRLGRVVEYESNVVSNSQDLDELMNSHESARQRPRSTGPKRADIPTRNDIEDARQSVKGAKTTLRNQETALEQLESLPDMADDARIYDWTIYEPLRKTLGLSGKETDRIFKDDDEPFEARHLRFMLQMRGPVEETADSIAKHWRDEKIPELREAVAKADRRAKALLRRYNAAIERLSRSRVIPSDLELQKIQRYESHLERGLHKAIGSLQTLQEARGAPPPTINLAVVQNAYGGSEMASFGNSSVARGSELILG